MSRHSKREEEERDILGELGGWLVYILLIIGLTYLIITFVGQRTMVSGSSMETTLQDGDNLIVDKVSYRFSDPRRYDIIVFPYRYKDMYFIKRIIGLPGETVQIKDGYIYINNEKLDAPNDLGKAALAGLAEYPISLDKNEYFLLGDNRSGSEDSRFSNVGNVKFRQIKGKVWLRIQPVSRFGLISSR